MVDYAKGYVLDPILIQKIKCNPYLQFVENVAYLVLKTGELKQKEIRKYKNMIFTFSSDKLEIDGSFHVLKNNGCHNADDFTVNDCIRTINSFCEKFEIPPILFNLTGIEFGLNLKVNIPVNDLLEALRFYKKNEFLRHHRQKSTFYSGSDYFEIKAYNKSEQYPAIAAPNLFRFEWKSKESKFLKQYNCRTLQDLLNPNMYKELSKILLSSWDAILVFDKTKRKGMKFHHTEYWKDTILEKHSNTFNNRKKIYYTATGRKNLHTQIYHLINLKVNTLNNCSFSTQLITPKYVIN